MLHPVLVKGYNYNYSLIIKKKTSKYISFNYTILLLNCYILMYNNKNYVYNLKHSVVFTIHIFLNNLREREKGKNL